MTASDNTERGRLPDERDSMLMRPLTKDGGQRNGRDSEESDRAGKRPLSWKEVWYEYSQSTSLNGVRFITQPTPLAVRRVFWLLVFIVGLSIFVYQVFERTAYYRSRPVTMSVNFHRNTTVVFPAVTVCNQNAFRMSAAAEQGMYHWLDAMYAQSDVTRFNYSHWAVGNVSLFSVLNTTAHTKRDLIVDCEWNHDKCGLDDFTTVFTDHGVCYTFNGASNSGSPRYVSETGSDSGLKLRLNVEEYEYMRGPHSAGGVKILLHRQHEVPSVRDLGDAIPAGSQAFVGVRLYQTKNLPEPHGDCVRDEPLEYFRHYSLTACKLECLTRFVVARCRCRAAHMPETMPGYPPVCDISSYTRCYVPSLDEFRLHSDECACPVPCAETHFDSGITYASTSGRNINTPYGSNDTRDLRAKYVRARETEQRVRRDIVDTDTKIITTLSNQLVHLVHALETKTEIVGRIETHIDLLMSKLRPRLKFHYKRGLLKLKYTVDHDFARSFEVMNERTFSHMTGNFYQLTALFRDTVSAYNTSLNGTDNRGIDRLREAWYVGTLRDLQKRRHLASKVLANITQVHSAFCNGTVIVDFEASPGRRYDSTYVWLGYLTSPKEAKYYSKLFKYTSCFIVNVDKLLQLNEDLYRRGILPDPATCEKVILAFEQCSRSYNYYRFLYEHKVVFRAQKNVQKVVDRFNRLNQTLSSKVTDIMLMIESLRSQARVLNDTSLDTVRSAVTMATLYLRDTSVMKLDIAAVVTSPAFRDDLQKFVNFFKDLRGYGQRLLVDWRRFATNYVAVWTNMLEEDALTDFYVMIHSDVDQLLHNDTARHLATIFANMTDVSADVIGNLSLTELNELLNADFAVVDRPSLYERLRLSLTDIIERNNLVTFLGEKVDVFAKTMDTFAVGLQRYQASVVIDAAFYRENFAQMNVYMRELTYQEIEQQEAYDLTALFSDIGGSMGLFVGGSIITVIELFDVVVHTLLMRRLAD